MSLDAPTIASFIAALAVALGVGYAGELRFLAPGRRNAVISAASGASLAYVFLGLLPKLVEAGSKVASEANDAVPFLSRHAFLLALVGTVAFYGLTVGAHATRTDRDEEDTSEETSSQWVFWPTVIMCALYLGLAGELLFETAEKGIAGLVVVGATLAFHFAGSDFGISEHHSRHRLLLGRWVLAPAVLAGWALGASKVLPEEATAFVSAFLVGAIIVTVLKDEVPHQGRARFVPFSLGALVAGLLLSTFAP